MGRRSRGGVRRRRRRGYDIAAEFVAVIGAGATPGSRLAEAASLPEAIGPGPKPGPKRIARYKKWYEQ